MMRNKRRYGTAVLWLWIGLMLLFTELIVTAFVEVDSDIPMSNEAQQIEEGGD